MYDLVTTYHHVQRQALRAIRRGDLDAAIRWTLLMKAHVRCARSAAELHNPRPVPAARPERRKPDPRARTST